MKVAFNGLNQTIATFESAAAIQPGTPVKMSGNGTVAAGSSADPFCGIAVDFNEDCTSVQMKGYIKVKYSGTAPTVGFGMMGADGNGKVKTVASNGTSVLIIDVDTANNLVGILL